MNYLFVVTLVVVFMCYTYVSYVDNDVMRMKVEMSQDYNYYLKNKDKNKDENKDENKDKNKETFTNQELKKKYLIDSYSTDESLEDNIDVNQHFEKIMDNLIIKKSQFVQPESLHFSTLFYVMKKDYLQKMSQINIHARNSQNINNLINKYKECCQKISDAEIIKFNNNIKNMLDKMHNKKLKKWIEGLLPGIYIVKGKNWLESGMPHTHANFMILNQSFFASFRNSTFIHELTHIHQRLVYDKYLELYDKWGFYYYDIKNIKGFGDIVLHNRSNPDGMDCNWILKNVCNKKDYWIGAVFNSTVPNDILSVYLEAYPLINQNGTVVYNGQSPQKIESFNDFKKLFCVSNNHYHPNEIAAQYMEFYYKEKKLNCKNYHIFKEWLEKLITIH